MGKGTRTFLYLLGIALLVYQAISSSSNTPAAEASDNARAVKKTASRSPAAKKTHQLRLPSINTEREEAVHVPPAVRDNLVKAHMRLNLSGNELDVLESSWSDLRQEAQAETTSDGWLLTHIEPNSLFARYGFQESDLVLKEELEDRYRDRDPEILERLERILNYIAR